MHAPLPNPHTCQAVVNRFETVFGTPPEITAYAPGRIEILGNHTDYNQGLVLACAIDRGICFAAGSRTDTVGRLAAMDLDSQTRCDVRDLRPSQDGAWANYVLGVLAHLNPPQPFGFNALFGGDIPRGAGLSSSAALEMSAGLAFCGLYGLPVAPLDLARAGQAAEHRFVGVRCGLLDQTTVLFARRDRLVLADFRALSFCAMAFRKDARFVMCRTHVRHALVDSAYNARRQGCERAARFFAAHLGRPVSALRDVSPAEWKRLAQAMDPDAARCSAHVIGENDRVSRGVKHLAQSDTDAFGRLMFESHDSSRTNFENSCPELDFLVDAARRTPGVQGARLSGGGFGGSAVVLAPADRAADVGDSLAQAYAHRYGRPCETLVVRPADGAAVVPPAP